MRFAVNQRWIVTWLLAILFPQLSVAQTTLVSKGSVWKYLDNGSDQGVSWQGLTFDDGSWASGLAELGYGNGDEATIINGGPVTNRFITTYFRHAFVGDPLAYTNLAVQLLRDDGAVVYLNGIEVFRSNMPTNDIDYATLALVSAPATDENTNFYAQAVDPSLMLAGTNVLAVEIHQWSSTSSDVSFDLALVGNFVESPPNVTITSPTNGARFLTANLILTADASDADDSITRVEFFQGQTKLGEAAVAPYSLVWPSVARGRYILTAVATDSRGLGATSAPVMITIPGIVSSGANWNYLDDGSDQGTAWQSPGFDDSGWASGQAQLGYGPASEATFINGGPATNRIITYYFRHYFEVADPAAFTNLVLRLLRDDGGIVYLNGTEVFRSNMPNGPVNYLTWAATVVAYGPQESEFYGTHVNPALLVAGDNVVAVEIHQANNTSSDVNFDLELIPNLPLALPTVSIASSAASTGGLVAPAVLDISVDATSFDSTVAQVQIYLGNNQLGISTTEPFGLTVSNVTAGNYLLWAWALASSGVAATSAPVAVTVAGGPVSTTLIATGSVWKYLDTGSTNQGTAWKEAGFNDSFWASGPAILGYGNATKGRPEATVINCCGPTGGKYITDYFRHQFVVSNAASFTNLYFRVLRDDGVVVYLNGSEIFRMNMPTGTITYATPSSGLVGSTNETFHFPTNISPALLVNGTNLLAVELHQSGPSTSDAAFDLELDGIAPPSTGPIVLNISNTGAEIVISWTANGTVLEKAGDVAGPWTTETSATGSPYRITSPGSSRFYRLRQP